MPVLAPIMFNDQGFPQLADINTWPSSVTVPLDEVSTPDFSYTDSFMGSGLSPQWEWNHNPDTSAYSVDNGLTLNTVTVTDDLYQARNTLTHRALGPSSAATVELDFSNMQPGDRAGLVMLRDSSAWVGVIDNGDSKVVGVWKGLNMTSGDSGWSTVDTGSLETSEDIDTGGSTVIYLRARGNFRPSSDKSVQFSYSTDGAEFSDIGEPFVLKTEWEFFMGYRYGIFNFATESLGGSVKVSSFTMEAVDE